MKPIIVLPLTIHKTYEKDAVGKRSTVLYLSDGRRLVDDKIDTQFVSKVRPGTVIRTTAINATDAVLLGLAELGAKIMYAHWHNLDLDKGAEPQGLVTAVAEAPDTEFREFSPNAQTAELRRFLQMRNALLQFYGDVTRRIKGAARDAGDVESASDVTNEALDSADAIRSLFKASVKKDNGAVKDISFDTHVKNLAMKHPQCVLFNKIAGIKDSWIIAASVVVYANGIERFPDVAAFWHYFGQHVVDGKSPSKRKGQSITWNPACRALMYNLATNAIVMQKSNPWHQVYRDFKEQELAMHGEKHPDCKTPAGHCEARAKRRVVKEILKQFYVAASGAAYNPHHVSVPR